MDFIQAADPHSYLSSFNKVSISTIETIKVICLSYIVRNLGCSARGDKGPQGS